MILILVYFSLETMEARRKWNNIYRILHSAIAEYTLFSNVHRYTKIHISWTI